MQSQNSAMAASSYPQDLLATDIGLDEAEELRLNQSLLVFATGLVCAAMMVWIGLYSLMGLDFTIDIPGGFFLLLSGNMFLYLWIRRFDFFRVVQLGLFLFLPFVAQWSTGNLIASSGIILWGLLAPIGAILCIGARESMGWFIAWIVLTALSGGVDYYLADAVSLQQFSVPLRTSLLFFTLNFISVASISYALLLFFTEQKRRAIERLRRSRQQLKVANEAAENLLRGPIMFI